MAVADDSSRHINWFGGFRTASVYRSLLQDRQALVVLDNAGSEEQVRPLLPGDGASQVLITARRLLAGLEGVRRLGLEPLSLPGATELLTGILGRRTAADEGSALTQLAGLCEGMPLALRIIGNRLVTRPGWDAAELAARLVDADREPRVDHYYLRSKRPRRRPRPAPQPRQPRSRRYRARCAHRLPWT